MEDVQERMLLTFEIKERLVRFGRAVDSRAYHMLDQVFLPDAVGVYNGQQGHRSLGELIEALTRNLGEGSNCGACQHNVMNVEASFDGRSGAVSRANFYALQEGLNEYQGQTYKTWGEYHDIWHRTTVGWRIWERRYTTLFNEGPKAIVGL